jgi:Cys-tRNA(Pro)/Cys-tRNA(Cys) deacylase
LSDLHKLHKNIQAAIGELETRYTVHDHSNFTLEVRTPYDVAAVLGYPIQRITKALLLRSHDRLTHAVAVCSIDRRLNFALAADAIGAKRLQVASLEDLQFKTGYPKNGVSPLGLADHIAVLVDQQLLDYPTVLIGGGTIGVELEITPSDLVRISHATVKCITTCAGLDQLS